MALPSSGEITLDNLNTHLKRASGTPISMNDSQVRALAARTSGAISMSDLHGKWAGSRITVGAGTSTMYGTAFYGYKAAGWTVSGAQAGVCDGQFNGANLTGAAWIAGSNFISLVTAEGQAKPSSTTIKITDDSFNVIGTYGLGAWEEINAGGGQWYTQSAVIANPFTTTAGVKRWFTW